jgi:transcriptional regulator NrdR family protein
MKLEVVKRDGEIENFDKAKIAKVAKAAGLTKEKADALARKVESELKNLNRDRVDSKQIRDFVAYELKRADSYAYGLYVWYEKEKDKVDK